MPRWRIVLIATVAQQLVLLVVERLRRRHDDRLARVDAHRVEVLHVADGDAVVARVAHDLVLDLFPARAGTPRPAPGARRRRRRGASAWSRSASVSTMPLPLPPRAKPPRSITGKPISRAAARASSAGPAGAAARGASRRSRQPLDEELAILGVADGRRSACPARARRTCPGRPASSSASPQLSAVWPPKESRMRVDLLLDEDALDELRA